MAWVWSSAGFDSSDRPDLVNAHQSHRAMLTAGLAGLPKVEEYSWRSVDSVACHKQRADQPEEPNVLEGSLADKLLQPCVVSARSHLHHPAHRSNVEAIPADFDKFVDQADFPVLACIRIGIPSCRKRR